MANYENLRFLCPSPALLSDVATALRSSSTDTGGEAQQIAPMSEARTGLAISRLRVCDALDARRNCRLVPHHVT